MANTFPTFFRRFEVFASFQGILEPVQVTLGFNGPVDPESGMVLNLSEVDKWVDIFKKNKTKKYNHSWAFARDVKKKFEALIGRHEFSQIYFDFQDKSIQFRGAKASIVWQQKSIIKKGRHRWRSGTELTMTVVTKKWPALAPAMETKLKKKLAEIDVSKSNWLIPGLQFASLIYYDPFIDARFKQQ